MGLKVDGCGHLELYAGVGKKVLDECAATWLDARERARAYLRDRPERTAFFEDAHGREAWHWDNGRIVATKLPVPIAVESVPLNRELGAEKYALVLALGVLLAMAVGYAVKVWLEH